LIIKIAALLSMLVLLNSCVPLPKSLPVIETPPVRMHQTGYSILPLDEPGWEIGKKDRIELVIGKRGNMDHTYVYRSLLVKLEPYTNPGEFVDVVKKSINNDVDTTRFNTVKHETVPHRFQSAICARSHLLHEDKKALKSSSKPGNMIMEMRVLTCGHPKDKQVGVMVIYSERYWPGDRDPKFDSRAEELMAGLLFENF
jgi:hypothetical protein